MPKFYLKRYKKKTAKLAPKTKRAVRGEIKNFLRKRAETKVNYQYLVQSTFSNTAPIFTNILDMAQGDGSQERIGDSIYLKGITMNVLFRLPINAAGTYAEFQLVRLIVFQYKTPNPATAPVITDLLTDSNGIGGSAAPGAASMKDEDYLKTHVVLYDKTWTMGAGLNVATANPPNGSLPYMIYKHGIRIPLKYCARKIQFINDGLTAVNPVYACVVAHSAPTALPTVAFECVVHFDDM